MKYIQKKTQDEITCYKKKTHHVSVLYEHAYLFYEKISYHKYIFYPQYLNCMVFPLYNVFTSVSFNLQKTSTTLRIKSLRDNKRNFIIKHLMVVLKITKKGKNKCKQNTQRFQKYLWATIFEDLMTIGFKNMLIHAWTIILSINRVIINWTSMDI